MSKNNIYHDLIEKYLEGTLTVSERETFEEQLKTDPILSKELLNRKMIQANWVKAGEREQVREHIHHVIKTAKSRQVTRKMSWLMAAASLLLVLGIGSLFFPQHNQNLKDHEFLLSSEKLIQGQQNEAKKYGKVDSLVKNKTDFANRYSPADIAIFNTTDTILFSWPANNRIEKLIIFDQKGIRILEKSIQSSSVEYKLLPSSLKPGTYTWTLPTDEMKHQFLIKN